MVLAVLELAACRVEVRLAHRRDHAFLVGQVALHRAHRGIDQQDAIVALRAVVGGRLAVVFLAVVADELDVGVVLQVLAPVARLELSERGVLHRRDRELVHRVHRVERELAAQAGLGILLEELDAHAARIEHEHRFRILRAQLGDFGLVVGLAEARVDLVHDAALEVALEAGEHVLAGGVVRRHQVDVLDALVLHVLAHRFRRLVVLPGGGEEHLVAIRAGKLVRAGVGADHEGARAGHCGRDCEHDVGPDHAGDEVDLVLLQHLLGDLLADIGLDLVVAVDHLGVEAADFALEMVERELDRVLHVLADHALRAGEGRNEADLEFLLREGRRCRANGKCGSGNEAGQPETCSFLHAFLLGKFSLARVPQGV